MLGNQAPELLRELDDGVLTGGKLLGRKIWLSDG